MITAKQITKLGSSYLKITGVTISASSSSLLITTLLTTACVVANVTLKTAVNINSDGIIISSPYNKVELIDSVNVTRITYLGSEVYGRITSDGSIYTLTLYSIQSGIETTYISPTNVTLTILLPYRFLFKDFNPDSAIISKSLTSQLDTAYKTGRHYKEELSVSVPNTISNLTFKPTPGTDVSLFVNGKEESGYGPNRSFTVTNTAIAWDNVMTGYDLDTADIITASYNTLF